MTGEYVALPFLFVSPVVVIYTRRFVIRCCIVFAVVLGLCFFFFLCRHRSGELQLYCFCTVDGSGCHVHVYFPGVRHSELSPFL